MRTGLNPEKFNDTLLEHKQHRVIIPVYIPHESGYFQHSFAVFQRCIDSLMASCGKETNITIINNNSVAKVDELCRSLVSDGKIDRYVINRENRGKAECVLAAARGSWEEFITVADADILFYHGWVRQVAEAFTLIPELGVFGLLTVPSSVFRATSSTIWWSLSRLRLRLGRIVSDETIREFVNSTGSHGTKSESEMFRSPQFYVRKKGRTFLLGANHAAATYRREVFLHDMRRKVPYRFRRKSKLIKHFFDAPSDMMGFCRMSYPMPLAYHMGNTLIGNSAKSINSSGRDTIELPEFPTFKPRRTFARLIPFPLRDRVALYFLKLLERLEVARKITGVGQSCNNGGVLHESVGD